MKPLGSGPAQRTRAEAEFSGREEWPGEGHRARPEKGQSGHSRRRVSETHRPRRTGGTTVLGCVGEVAGGTHTGLRPQEAPISICWSEGSAHCKSSEPFTQAAGGSHRSAPTSGRARSLTVISLCKGRAVCVTWFTKITVQSCLPICETMRILEHDLSLWKWRGEWDISSE